MTDDEYCRNSYFPHLFEGMDSLELVRNTEQGLDNAHDKGDKVGDEIAKLKLVVKTAEEVLAAD